VRIPKATTAIFVILAVALAWDFKSRIYVGGDHVDAVYESPIPAGAKTFRDIERVRGDLMRWLPHVGSLGGGAEDGAVVSGIALVGTFLAQGEVFAIVRVKSPDDSKGRIRKVLVGDQLGDMLVVSIGRRAILLRDRHGERELQLFKLDPGMVPGSTDEGAHISSREPDMSGTRDGRTPDPSMTMEIQIAEESGNEARLGEDQARVQVPKRLAPGEVPKLPWDSRSGDGQTSPLSTPSQN